MRLVVPRPCRPRASATPSAARRATATRRRIDPNCMPPADIARPERHGEGRLGISAHDERLRERSAARRRCRLRARPASTPPARCSRATRRRRGRHDRAAADAVGPRPARRRARPPEHQGRLAGVREDRGSGPGSGSSATSRSGGDVTHEELAERYDAVALRGRRADRPAARHPRRGPARLVGRDGVRRLVQRPPRLPGPRVRPLARAGGRDRERQRRARRRAHARADAGGARADGHDGRGDRGDRRLRRSARSSSSAAAGRCRRRGRRSRSASSASWPGADIVVDPAAARARRGQRGRARGGAADREAERRSSCASYAGREPTGKPRAIRLRFLASPVAILGDEQVEAIELVRNELVRTARPVRASRPTSARRCRAGSSSGASATTASPLPGVPVRRGQRDAPERGRPRLASRRAVLYGAGWIKRGPSGVIGTNKKDATETVELLLEDARAGALSRGVGRGSRGAARRARRRARHVRGLGGDRRGRACGGRALTAAPASSCAPGTSCSRPLASAAR